MINLFWSDEDLLLLGVIAAREADNRGWRNLVQNWKELYYKNKEELKAWMATAERATSLAECATNVMDSIAKEADWLDAALIRVLIIASLLGFGWFVTIISTWR